MPNDGSPARPVGARGRLNRPWRALVALAELALAAVAVWLAFTVWAEAITDFTLSIGDGERLTLSRYHGELVFLAIGVGLLATLLVVDAVRQLMLAWRTRPKRDGEPWPSFDEDSA